MALEMPAEAEAIVVALKSRTAPVAEAVAQSLAACRWLRAGRRAADLLQVLLDLRFDGRRQYRPGRRRAAATELGADFATVCPAFPETGRTIYQRPSVRRRRAALRLLDAQPPADADDATPTWCACWAARPRRRSAWCPMPPCGRARRRSARRSTSCATAAIAYAVVDAIEDEDLRCLGAACADLALVTGGSGVAIGLPGNFRRAGLLATRAGARRPAARRRRGGGALRLLLGGDAGAGRAHARAASVARCSTRWTWRSAARRQSPTRWPGRTPSSRRRTGPDLRQRAAGGREGGAGEARPRPRRRAGRAGARRAGARPGRRRACAAWWWPAAKRSGAVVQALGVEALRIGPQIDPGVPATVSLGEPQLALALKSGNFGAEDFFLKAIETLR